MIEEYRQCRQVESLLDASIWWVLLALGHFRRLVGPNSSSDVTQASPDAFMATRSEELKNNTLNKDVYPHVDPATDWL